MNEVKLQGQITSDPEVKESRNGILRGSFLVTTKGGTEDRPRYDYIRCVIWDEKAQYVADHFEKGQLVSIEGSVRGRFYPNRAGTTSYAMEVYPEHMECADSTYSF